MDEREIILDEFKVFVETADKVSERRAQANNFFVTINTALLAAFPVILDKAPNGDLDFFAKTIGVAGILLNIIWFLTIRTYKALNSAKFKAIHEMEEKLPYQPFKREWEEIKKRKWGRKYLTLSGVEAFLPIAFIIVFWTIISRFLSIGWLDRLIENIGC